MEQLFVTIEDGKAMPVSNAKSVGEVFAIPYALESITVEQAQTIYRTLEDCAPADYLEIISAQKDMPDEDTWYNQLPANAAALAQAVCAITGIPQSAMALPLPELWALLGNFEFGVVLPLYNAGFLKPNPCRSFEFEGVAYINYAAELDCVNSIIMPDDSLTTERWCMAHDFARAMTDPAEHLPFIIAILCRPEGEEYDEAKARKRAEIFKRLPMRLACDCYFTFAAIPTTLLDLTNKYLLSIAAQKQANKPESK